MMEKNLISNEFFTSCTKEVDPVEEKNNLKEGMIKAIREVTSLEGALPVLGIIGALSLRSPEFTTGLYAGGACYCFKQLSHNMCRDVEEQRELTEGDVRYVSQLGWFDTVLVNPIIEELFYRWAVQGSVQHVFSHVACLFSDSDQAQKIASIAGVISTSVLFGLDHMNNGHSAVKRQSILAMMSGISFGFMKERFGLISSIGAHMANNFLAMGSLYLTEKRITKEDQIEF